MGNTPLSSYILDPGFCRDDREYKVFTHTIWKRTKKVNYRPSCHAAVNWNGYDVQGKGSLDSITEKEGHDMISIRKIGVLGRTYRHMKRYRQILHVLFKYGFGRHIDSLMIDKHLDVGVSEIPRKMREQAERLGLPVRIRMAMVELGPTFVKLGQILSTRPDLIPLEYIKEFSKLQDKVPPFPYAEVKETITAEMGKPPEEVFEHFEQAPFAAASIGQVHRARLKNGEEVVVKVQRPHIRKVIEVDLEIMLHLASLMERHLEELEFIKPTQIAQEFARSIEEEIDYTKEASHVERFARQFVGDHTIYVPRVYREYSSMRVITLEEISGIKVSQIERLKNEGCDLAEINRRGATALMNQIFVYGFFHADPHPGNIFILPDNVICFIDYGMMGHVSKQEREDFAGLLLHVFQRNEKKTVDSLLSLTYYDKKPDREKLERDVFDFIDQYAALSMKEINLGETLDQILNLVMRHGLTIRPHFFLMMKALSTIEGVGKSLDPNFDIIGHAQPFVRRIQMARLSPKRIVGDLIGSGTELVELLKEIPAELRSLLQQAREGKLQVEYHLRGLNRALRTHDRISNRISFAIVIASLVISSSLIVHSNIPPRWHEIPVIGIVGYLAAGLLGFWLIISILRRGRL